MESMQPELWASEFVTFAAATTFLILRLLSRKIAKTEYWWDDYFAICCYVFSCVWAVVISLWIDRGFGLHSENVEGVDIQRANSTTKKYLFFVEYLYAIILFFAKISMLCFYWRIFRVADIKTQVRLLTTFSTIWLLARILLTTFHCYPIEAFWNPQVEHAACPVKSSKFFFSTVLAHVLIDAVILVVPIAQIYKLQLPALQKAGTVLMFMFGVLVCLSGLVIVGISSNFNDQSKDMTWDLAPIIIWASVEVNLVTVSTCIPMMKPACLYLTRRHPSSMTRSVSRIRDRAHDRDQVKHSTRLVNLSPEDSSSTNELIGPSRHDDVIFAHSTQHANIAFVTGPNGSTASHRDMDGDRIRGGIMVTNETVVRVTAAKKTATQRTTVARQ